MVAEVSTTNCANDSPKAALVADLDSGSFERALEAELDGSELSSSSKVGNRASDNCGGCLGRMILCRGRRNSTVFVRGGSLAAAPSGFLAVKLPLPSLFLKMCCHVKPFLRFLCFCCTAKAN